MFEPIIQKINDTKPNGDVATGYLCALSFNNTQERGDGIVHTRLEGDERQTCAEYNRRVVEKVARNRSWCPCCTEMIISKMVVKDCQECFDDQKIRYDQGLEHSYTIDNTRWWSLEEEEIQQLVNSPMSFGEDRLSHWPVLASRFELGLKLLGLSPDCPVCLGLAKSILQDAPNYGYSYFKILGISVQWRTIDDGLNEVNRRHSFPFKINVLWDEGEWKSHLREIDVRLFSVNDVNGPGLLCHKFDRCNPAVLKQHIQNQFKKYPDENLRQTAEYPRSFRLIDVCKRCVVNIGNRHVRYSAVNYNREWYYDQNILTFETQQKFAQYGSLSLKTMCKTLYDSMTMARLLEIPYIWIDRYCIIQDDTMEKVEHFHAMEDIYANSYLTMICALYRGDGRGISGYTLDFDGRPTEAPDSDCRGTIKNIPHISNYYPKLREKGWLMEEAHFSPRRLYFTNSTILWHINCPMVAYHHAVITKEPDSRAECVKAQPRLVLDLITYYLYKTRSEAHKTTLIFELLTSRGIDHVLGIPTRQLQHGLCWQSYNGYGNRNDQFPSWSWAHRNDRDWHCLVQWEERMNITHWLKCKILHAHAPAQKQISFVRQLGLPKSILIHLSDRQLLIRTRVKKIGHNEKITFDVDNEATFVP